MVQSYPKSEFQRRVLSFVTRRLVIGSLIASALVCVGARSIFAQGMGAAASLTGFVADASGAAIPDVKLQLTEINTGAQYVNTTNQVGYYLFPHLPYGTYKLKASKQGFGDAVVSPIPLVVGQAGSADLILKPGKVVQQVSVSASQAQLETQSSDTTQTISATAIEALPTPTRSVISEVQVMPGVTSSFVNSNGTAGTGATTTAGINDWSREDFNAVGAPPANAIVLIDGADVRMDHVTGAGTPAIVPSPDDTEEFKLQTTNYGPENGWGYGVINIVSKSGTNTLHGTLFEYNQNSHLIANDFFTNAYGQKKGYSNRNQFGGYAGGPVYIPKLYNGTNRTWWFFGLERFQQNTPFPTQLSLPTAAEEGGDFSQAHATSGQLYTIYNPFDTYVDPTTGKTLRRPFPNNQIPSAMIGAFAKKITSFYPSPNNPGEVGTGGVATDINNYYANLPASYKYSRLQLKIDEQISEKHHIMGRLSYQPDTTPGTNEFGVGNVAGPGTDSSFNIPNNFLWENAMISHTWNVSSNFMINQHFSYAREDANWIPWGFNYDPTQLGGLFADGRIAAYAKQYNQGIRFPDLGIGSYQSMGGGGADGSPGYVGHGDYAITMVLEKGKHEIKWGWQAQEYTNADITGEQHSVGSYGWSGSWSCGPDPLLCSNYTGNGLADLELGLIGSGSISSNLPTYVTNKRNAWYVSDNWRVSPRLTLNLGLRYDIQRDGYDRYLTTEAFDPYIQNPIGNMIGPNTNGGTVNQYLGRVLLGSFVLDGTPEAGGKNVLGKLDPFDFAPRLGFAYHLKQNWVVRGGWARVYGDDYGGGGSAGGSTPFQATTNVVSTIDGITPVETADNAYLNGFNAPLGRSGVTLLSGVGFSTTAGPEMDKVPYINQWNIGFERAFPGNALLKVSYVGTRGKRLGCPLLTCGDQLPLSDSQEYGEHLYDQVPNPFYGIITAPGTSMAEATISRGHLLNQYPQFAGIALFPDVNSSSVWPVFQNEYPFRSAWDGMLVSFQKQFSQGSTILVAYTLSKQLSNVDSVHIAAIQEGFAWLQDERNLNNEYSLAMSDIPQRLVVSHVYRLPVGRGQHYGSNMNPVANAVLGGWRATGILTLSSGFPIQDTYANNQTGVGGGYFATQRPNLIGTPKLTSGSLGQKLQDWIDPSAFAAPAPFTFGNAPRVLNDGMRGDALRDYDFSLMKEFPLKERLNLQFRWDSYNLFNHPHFAQPNYTFGGGSFGLVSGTDRPPRYMQFGMKLVW